MSYNMELKLKNDPLRPDQIYYRDPMLKVKPLEAKYFKVNLAMQDEKLQGEQVEWGMNEESPLIMYFVKDATALARDT